MSDSLSRYELEVVSPNIQAARRACVKAVSLVREQQSRAGMERGQRAAARAQTQLGMVHISPRREGRMPIIQLCPVHTEPDQ